MEKKLPSPQNPLAVIAILVAAVESFMGTAVALLDPGHAQTVLVYAMVGIFAVVIFGFFFILYRHPGHFYSPEQFQKETAHTVFTGKERDFPVVDTRGKKRPSSSNKTMRKTIRETKPDTEVDPSAAQPGNREASQ